MSQRTMRALLPLLLLVMAMVIVLSGQAKVVGILVGVAVLIGLTAVSVDLLAVALLLAAIALVQPFAYGAGHTTLGSGIACAAGLAALVGDSFGDHERAHRASKSLLVWVTCSALWTLALATQHPGLDVAAAQKSIEALVAVVGAAVLVLRKNRRRLWFARALVLILAGFSASYLVSLLLWLKDGFGSHQIGGISIRGYKTEPVYFPLTPTSGSTLIHGWFVPRLLGPMREPGLFQALLVWSLFMTERLGLKRRSLKLLLLVGVLATQSTAGLGILLVVWVLTSVMADGSERGGRLTMRHIGGMVVLVAALFVAVFAPAIGVQAKQTSNAASVSDRWTNTRAGLVTLVEAPLGRDYTDYPPNVAINLLAATTLVGAPGLALGLAAFLRPIRLSARRRDAWSAGLPLFLTALVAQPVLDAPAFYVVLMAGLVPFAVALAPGEVGQSVVERPAPTRARLQHV